MSVDTDNIRPLAVSPDSILLAGLVILSEAEHLGLFHFIAAHC